MILRQGQVLDEYGRGVAGAQIYVFNGNDADAELTIDGSVPLTQPVLADQFGIFRYYADSGVYREDTYYGGKLRMREVIPAGLDGLYPPRPRAGMYFAFDANENPIAAYGTGADLGLRADLAASSGSALVGHLANGAQTRSVQDKLNEVSSALDFLSSAKRTDVLTATQLYDHSVEATAANQSGAVNHRAVYFPARDWMRGSTSASGVTIKPTLLDGESVVMYGDGPGKTLFRDSDYHTTAMAALGVDGNFDEIFYWQILAPGVLDNLVLRDFTIDKNGATAGTPPGLYTWQHNHGMLIETGTGLLPGGRIRSALVENVNVIDKIGAGINFGRGFLTNAMVRNCHFFGFDVDGVIGQRGDLEFQATIDNLSVEGCSGTFVQCEPNLLTAEGLLPRASFSDCIFDNMEFTGYSNDVTAQTVILKNCQADRILTAQEIVLQADGCRFTIDHSGAPFRWTRLGPTSLVSNSSITVAWDSVANAIYPFYPAVDTNAGNTCTFKRNRWVQAAGADAATTGAAIRSQGVYNGAQPFLYRFEDETFLGFERTADCYRNGNYEFVRCIMAGRSADVMLGTIHVGGGATNYGTVLVDSCDFDACTSLKNFTFINANTLWKLIFRGAHKYAWMTFGNLGTTPENMVSFEGVITHNAAPTGSGIKNMVVTLPAAPLGSPCEYICTVSHESAATFRMTRQRGIAKGLTAARPAATAADVGLLYEDTNLDPDGKLIIWLGAGWFDAAGAAA